MHNRSSVSICIVILCIVNFEAAGIVLSFFLILGHSIRSYMKLFL